MYSKEAGRANQDIYDDFKLKKKTLVPVVEKYIRVCILVQVTIYRRLLIGRDGHLDQSEAYDIS